MIKRRDLPRKESRKLFSKKSWVWILILAITIMQVGFALETTTNANKIAELDQRIKTFSKRNIELQQELIMTSSLTALDKKAEELGFVKTQDALYIREENSFARIFR